MREYMLLDTSRFPVVVGTYQEFFPTAEEFRKWQSDLDAYNVDHANYVIILDFSKVQPLPTEFRIMAAMWTKQNDDLFVRKNIKAVFYTPSLMHRVMMKAVLLMSGSRATYELVSSLEKAYAWANKQAPIKESSYSTRL